MVGKFENVKVLTCEKRQNKKCEKYYIYNLLCDGRIYNMYAKECFEFSPDVETDVEIELHFFNGSYSCKLVGVA